MRVWVVELYRDFSSKKLLWELGVGNHWSSLPYILSSIILCTTVCMNIREEVGIGVSETMNRLLPKNSSMKYKISSISLHDIDQEIRTLNSRRSWSVACVDPELPLKKSSKKYLDKKIREVMSTTTVVSVMIISARILWSEKMLSYYSSSKCLMI